MAGELLLLCPQTSDGGVCGTVFLPRGGGYKDTRVPVHPGPLLPFPYCSAYPVPATLRPGGLVLVPLTKDRPPLSVVPLLHQAVHLLPARAGWTSGCLSLEAGPGVGEALEAGERTGHQEPGEEVIWCLANTSYLVMCIRGVRRLTISNFSFFSNCKVILSQI